MRRISRLLSALSAASLVSHFAAAQCGPFFSPPDLLTATTYRAQQILTADLNGDGFTDVVVTSGQVTAASSGFEVFLGGNGSKLYRSQFVQLGSTEGWVRMCLADVNRDGRLDAIVVERATNSVRVFLGNGDGTFVPGGAGFNTGTNPSNVIAADINGDGNTDLIVANYSDGTIGVLLGTGNGTFFPMQSYPALPGATAMALIDLKSDHRPALLVGSTSGAVTSLALLQGNGAGGFSAPVLYPIPANVQAYSIAVADIDGDHVPDVLCATGNVGSLVFLGKPNGTLAAGQFINNTANLIATSIAVVDFNGDGWPDFVLGTALGLRDTASPTVFINDKHGAFTPLTYGSWGEGDGAIAVGDFNHDTLPDVLYADAFNGIGALRSLAGGPIQILGQPANATRLTGESASFTVTSIAPNLSYRWYKQGTPVVESARVSGAFGPVLAVNNLTEADSGIYECELSNTCNTTRVAAFLSVQAPSTPACPADFNSDGFVDIFDFNDFITAFEIGC